MNLRLLARNRPCMIRLPEICCHDPATTVLAHYRHIGISGMGIKSPDLLGAWACARCHDAVDSGTRGMTREERELALLRGVIRTQYELIREGKITW